MKKIKQFIEYIYYCTYVVTGTTGKVNNYFICIIFSFLTFSCVLIGWTFKINIRLLIFYIDIPILLILIILLFIFSNYKFVDKCEEKYKDSGITYWKSMLILILIFICSFIPFFILVIGRTFSIW